LEFVDQPLETGDIDVAILGDVLEHFSMKNAQHIITRLKDIVKKAIIVQMPLGAYEQQVEINPLENHKSYWLPLDIQKLQPAGLRKFTDFSGREFVVFAIPK
jgi:hypothetical protein